MNQSKYTKNGAIMLNIVHAGLCGIQNWIENTFPQEVELEFDLEWQEEEFFFWIAYKQKHR